MGRYQDLVATCKRDRSRCPELPRKPPTLDLSRSQDTYLRLIRGYPRFRKLDTVLYLYAFSLRDQGRVAEAIAGFERLLAEYPRSRFRADAWMALAEHRFYERQDFGAAARAYERVLEVSRARRSTVWRCSRPPGAPGSWDGPTKRPPASSRCWTSASGAGARASRSRSGPPSCRIRPSSTWSSCSPRTTARPPRTPTTSSPRSAARPTRSGCSGASPTRCTTRPATSGRRMPTST